MASSDWLDIRGWMDSIIGWSLDKTHQILPSSDIGLGPLGSINIQDGFSSIQSALHIFIFTSVMCTVVFATMMITLIVVPYIERKFIGRLMDRFGNTMSARSLWVGEGGVTAGEWWSGLPLGLGAPIGAINKALNKNFGNDHHTKSRNQGR